MDLYNQYAYINGYYMPDAYRDGKLWIYFYPIKNQAIVSGIILLRGWCNLLGDCNMCYDRKCISCSYYNKTECLSCIENANLEKGFCNCNFHSYYVSASNSCEVCDGLCKTCNGGGLFLCNYCDSPSYYLVKNVCLRACPYGFSASCSPTSGPVIDQSFADYFNGSYGIFRTGESESRFYFFNSPESSDPIPAKNRGLYFNGNAYLETTSSIYLSPNFSIGFWVWNSTLAGDFVTHQNSLIQITWKGSLEILLENHLQSPLRIATKIISAPANSWMYLSYVVSFESTSTVIKTYLNNVAQESISFRGYIYRDMPDSNIILGRKLDKSYIYKFQLWNSAISNFYTQYFDQLCGAGAKSSCLWSIDIFSYIDDGKIYPCDELCSKGCVTKSCNVCDDPLCSICQGFSSGLCTKCIENASGTPCSCNLGYILSESGYSCTSKSSSNSLNDQNELVLLENNIYNENLFPIEWKYYKVSFYQGHKNIALFINSNSSTTQIYINLNWNNTKPTLDAKNYYFDNFVNETLKINLNWDSIAYSNCYSLLKGHYDPTIQCAYHIGMFSSSSSSEYSIKFKSIPIVPKQIHINKPIASNMTFYEHKYLYGIIDVNETSFIEIYSSLGRTSLYISLFDYGSVGKDSTKWPLPYSSSQSFITIKPIINFILRKINSPLYVQAINV